MFWGKLICAFLGYKMGGIFGGLLGLWLGHAFDRALSHNSLLMTGAGRKKIQRLFLETSFQLIGHIAKADGRVSEAEIAQTENLMTRMGLSPEHRKEAIELFKRGTLESFDFSGTLANFKQETKANRNLSMSLLELLISVALADGKLDPEEQTVLHNTAAGLGMNTAQFDQLLQMILAQNNFSYSAGGSSQYQGAQQSTPADQLKQAYQALGVSEDIDNAGLKKAYRRLMSQHHPDKLIARGVPEDMIKIATEKSQQIQAAYEMVKKSRG